jgi:glutaredoxin
MEFEKPLMYEFTIYSKSGCPNCRKVKALLSEMRQKYTVINCDEYLLDYKDEFLQFIYTISKTNITTFPIIFDSNNYIGGFLETKQYLSLQLDFDTNF